MNPIDELHRSADEIWARVAPGYELTDADIAVIIEDERAKREAWQVKDSRKKIAREEKKSEKQDKESDE